MTNTTTFITYQKRQPTVMERINQKETVYICYNSEDEIMFGTVSMTQAMQFCRLNDCNYSTYPPKTFSID